MKYKARILKKSIGFAGELNRGIVIEHQTSGYDTPSQAVDALNIKIAEFNKRYNIKIPLMTDKDQCVTYESDEPDEPMPHIVPSTKITEKPTSNNVAKQEPTSDKDEAKPEMQETEPTKPVENRKKTKPRKPFTPYGLNGYFVDKLGNVRLNLDRKASSRTITLTPEMFSMLAEMVKKTQEQQNATT